METHCRTMPNNQERFGNQFGNQASGIKHPVSYIGESTIQNRFGNLTSGIDLGINNWERFGNQTSGINLGIKRPESNVRN